MIQKYHSIIDFLPFFLSAGNGMPRMNLPRLIETVAIALITAFITMYATQRVIQTEMKYINANHEKSEARTAALFREMKISINRIETNFLNHVEKHNATP